MARILLVDDEENLIWALRNSLSDEDHEVFSAYDGFEALEVARRRRPDLVVLDIAMPHLDGLGVCRLLRRDPDLAAVPILFLTAYSAIEHRVAGLEEGGDDYLVKPFDMAEWKARVKALLRRGQLTPRPDPASDDRKPRLRVGPLALDLRACQLHLDGRIEQLTPMEFDLLHYLMTHSGEVFSSQHLLEQVWGCSPGVADPSLVRWHIKNLRTKIEPDPTHPIYIRTIPRHGYVVDESQPPP